jgi:YVTN family beta-propeller protein
MRSLLLFLCVVLAGCQAGLTPPRGRLESEGGLYVYLQPPRAAVDVRPMTIDDVTAVGRDGASVPLRVVLRDSDLRKLSRQRLLAAAAVPAGDYTALVLRTRPPGTPREQATSTTVPVAFSVRRREAEVIAVVPPPGVSAYVPERPTVGRLGFVSNSGSDDVTVFDKHSRQVVDVMATGRRPAGMALDQRGRRLYVALAEEDAVEVLDVMAGHAADRVRLTPGDEPVALALTPDGRVLLCANRSSNSVSLIDPVSRFEQARVAVGGGPGAITLDRTGRRAFVVNTQSNSISVVDVGGRAVVRTIPTEPGPVQTALNRRGDRLFVVHQASSYVIAINVNTLAPVGRFQVRDPMDAIEVDPGTEFVYLASARDLRVGVHDALSFGPVDFIDTGAGVTAIAVDAEENALYLVTPATNGVVVADRVSKRVAAEIDTGHRPVWVSVMGER